ncbi:HpaII family restriction endonuclease [bacterium]|nr:HpaII family restriction endonuclease [bacterium]
MTKKVSGNWGNWGEFWVFLKALEDGRFALSDMTLNPIKGKNIAITKVYREDLIFDVMDSHVSFVPKDGKKIEIKKVDIKSENIKLLNEFNTISEAPFECVQGYEALKLLHQEKLCDTRATRDISFEIVDPLTALHHDAGFSIKTVAKGKPTLFNCNAQSRLIFEIDGFRGDLNDVNKIEGYAKVIQRVNKIIELGGKFSFVSCFGATFQKNLIKIDSQMPELLALAVLANFQVKVKNKRLGDVLQSHHYKALIKNLKIPLEIDDVIFKFKNLLMNVACGMTAAKPWNGITDVDGGLLVVRKDWEVVCFHIFNFGQLQSYLYDNIKFDTPNSRKNNIFGHLYKENGKLLFMLNFQFRWS